MNLDSLSFALSQISFSVANLTKKNFKSNIAEISNLVVQYKSEAYRHLLRCLFSHVDFSGDNRSSGKDLYQTQYLVQECEKLLGKPNFVSIFCYAVDNPLHHQKSLRPSQHLFTQLSKVLKLTCVQEVAFGLAALESSSQEIRKYAVQFVKQKLPQLLNSYIESGGSLRDAPIEVIHLILSRLVLEKSREAFGVSAEQKEKFIQALSKDFSKELVPVVLSPLIYSEVADIPLSRLIQDNTVMSTNVMGPSLAEMVLEMGPGFTKGIEQCRSALAQVGVKALTPSSVARVIGMMIKGSSGFSENVPLQNPVSGWVDSKDSGDGQSSNWNAEVFVKVVKEMVPNLSWPEVVKELDHPGFIVNGKQGLELLMQALFLGLGETDNFPVDVLYVLWKNKDGQLSWLISILKNPDVFCLIDFKYRLSVIDCLKVLPDEENRDIASWKSLDLIDILLQLSDEGLYQQVFEMFKFPVAHCPDLLLLGLLQVTRWNHLKRELVLSLIPIFLGNHPNAVAVLQFAWHCQNQSTPIRPLVLQAMADWYMRDIHDQIRLSRVLDVAHDLKALSILLNGSTFAFVIDLACLASRREYLKLDKWLTDKIREHQEPFVQECVKFLMIRCPQLAGKDDQMVSQSKSQQLQAETITTMLSCLQSCMGTCSPDLQEHILSLTNNAAILMNTKKPAVSGSIPGIGPRTGMPSSIPGLQGTMGNPMDPLGSAVAMVNANPGVSGSAMSSQYPAGISGLGALPGSPSKNFPQLGQGLTPVAPAQSAGFSNMQALTSQLQGLNLQSALNNTLAASLGTGIGTGLGTGFGPGLGSSGLAMVNRGAPSLSALSTQVALSQQQPRLEGLRPAPQTSELATMFPNQGGNLQFSKEVEDEANSYFQRIYNNTPNSTPPPMSVEQTLELLKNFKDSQVEREKEVFQCMLRNLFEEFRFFSQYPDRELQTTAMLFGGIIEQGLITYMALGVALRSVLEALKKPHGSKMYNFGLTALDRFKTKLREYPQYCQFLASIPHFQEFPTILKEYIEYGARSADPPHAPVAAAVASTAAVAASLLPPPPPPPPVAAVSSAAVSSILPSVPASQSAHGIISRPSTSAAPARTSIAGATNIDTLLANKEGIDGISVPPELLQDRVFFIFNNLSQSNMDQKAGEMKEAIGDEYMPWVSQYLVMKRASIEHNFHTLYANFIDHLKKPEFLKMVIKETFRNIKVLLRSDKGAANFSDRTLLKNLGHWLGMLTLAKNKPVLYIDIDLKSLVYEAYHKGSQELLYVVPFVAKIIESAQRSRVFKPPNPWTMAIMNVLGELHMEPDIRLNLKFEIEVLCKNLSIDVNDLVPGSYLKDVSRLSKLEHQLSPPSKPKDSSTPQPEEPLQINIPTPTTTMMTQVISNPVALPGSVPLATAVPLQPQYGYNEINLNISNLAHHIVINEQLALFQVNPQLKQYVRPAIERAIQEMIPAIIERAIKVAITTSEQIVKKDFALDPDETHLRTAAHNLTRFMTAGMALIVCHEPIHISICTQLKSIFLTALRGASQQQKEMIEQAANMIAGDNTELATVFLQKTAVEKALPEMDKRLNPDYEARKIARSEGRRYCDAAVLKYQMERMPEEIRLRHGGIGSHQLTIYDELATNIPGFLPSAAVEGGLHALPYSLKSTQFGPEDIVQVYDKICHEIEQCIGQFSNSPLINSMRTLLEYILLARNAVRDVNASLALLQRAVEGLLDGMMLTHCETELMVRYRDSHLLVLKTLQDPRMYGLQWTNKQVTRCLIECRDELRYSIDAVDTLIRNQLVVVPQYDLHLAQLIEASVNPMAIAFGMQLIQRFCLESDRNGHGIQEGEFNHTFDALSRVALHSRQLPEGLPSLLDAIRQRNGDLGLHDRSSLGQVSVMHSGMNQAREFDDPPGLHEKTEYLLREWVSMYHSPAAGRDSLKAFNAFAAQMHIHGILKTDDIISRFFRLCTEMCVDLCYRALTEQNQNQSVTRIRAQCFHTLDAFVRLAVLLLKHSGDMSNTLTKITLLNKVLGIVVGILLQDHEVRRTEFNQLPYHRILIMLFIELSNPEPVLETINLDVLQAFSNTLHLLRPVKAPAFAYAWLELVSHRVFVGRMLAGSAGQRTWGLYAQLLIDLFTFLSPFLRNAELTKSVQLLYKGTMRVLLVMLHDFPEFLCDYHYAFCDVIPPNCIQVRNLILSAFPRNMRLPDPFTPNLKVDTLPEIANAPRIITNFCSMIQPPSLRKDLDSYLLTRSPVTFLSELRSKLQVSNTAGLKYNIPLMNAIVLHVGTLAIQQIQKKGHTPNMSAIAHSSHMDIFQNLAVDLDTEGRYLFLNAMANQLRYPNSHTHYFSCTLLYLFAEANTEAIQEQITRVLLERLIVNRPHPWGLLITFIELIKNPQFKFWTHEFVRCAPEIEKLLDSVARSCMPSKPPMRDQDGQELR